MDQPYNSKYLRSDHTFKLKGSMSYIKHQIRQQGGFREGEWNVEYREWARFISTLVRLGLV